MKKKIITMLLAVAMLFAVSVSASAEDATIVYESAFNADTGFVTVTVYIDGALGLQAADLCLGFDEAMYAFENYETVEIEDGMIIAGYTENTPGLVTCSLIFTEECVESDLDSNGRLNLVTYTFKPVIEEYDINEFYLWTSGFSVDDVDIFERINSQGNQSLQEGKTDGVSMPSTEAQVQNETTTKKGTEKASGDLTSKWYVYVIAGVLAVGAIAGIAMVAIKSNHNEDEEKSEEKTDEKTEE